MLVVHFSLCSCALRLLFTMLLFFFIVPIISFDISLRIYLSTSLSSSKSFFFLSSLLRLHCSSPCQKFLPFSPVYFYKSFLFLFVRIFSKKKSIRKIIFLRRLKERRLISRVRKFFQFHHAWWVVI